MRPGNAPGAALTVAPDTPVRRVMEHMRDGIGAIAVVEGGKTLGLIRPDMLIGRLLNPQGGPARPARADAPA